MEGHRSTILCLAVGNRLIYSGSADRTVKGWVTEFGDCTLHYRGHKHSILCMKYHKGFREYQLPKRTCKKLIFHFFLVTKS